MGEGNTAAFMNRKKLRIAMLFTSDPSQAGGVQQHIEELSKQLEHFGNSVDVFGPKNTIYAFPHYREVGFVKNVRMPNGNIGNIGFSEQLPEFLSGEDGYDLLHIHEPYLPFISWQALWAKKIPIVATFHTAWGEQSTIAPLSTILPIFRPMASKIDGAIYVSRVTKRCWEPVFPSPVLSDVIPHGVSDRFLELDSPIKEIRDSVRILFLARLAPKKGLIYVLRAIDVLRKKYPEIIVDIVGDGVDRSMGEIFVAEHSLGSMVQFHGMVYGEERIRFFQKADIFVAPYIDEAFGMTVIEAMACNVPVVGFDIDAFQELFSHSPIASLFVTPGDQVAFTNALENLLQSKTLRRRFSQWSAKERKKYQWSIVAKKTLALYERVLHTI